MKVGHFPQKMGNNLEHNCRSIARINPLFGGMTEQDWGKGSYLPRIRKSIGSLFRILTEDKGGHSQECPILFRKVSGVRWKITDVSVVKLSEDLGLGIGNDRWQIEVRAETRIGKKRKVGLIWTHWNAAIQNKQTGEPLKNARWREMDTNAGEILESAIRQMKKEKRTVFVGGDFNYRDKGKSDTWKYAPENIFKRTRMKVHSDGLDWLAWTRDVEPKGGVREIQPDENNPKAVNRSDHPWLVGNFVWKK